MITTLYLIAAEEEDCNFDLFVSARDESEAIGLWCGYYGLAQTEKIDRVRVAVVPEVSEVPRAHPWHGWQAGVKLREMTRKSKLGT